MDEACLIGQKLYLCLAKNEHASTRDETPFIRIGFD